MSSPSAPGDSRGLAWRLMAGQCVVLVAGAVTVGLVAAVVGPPIFHQHLLEAGLRENSSEMAHIEMAYRDASVVSIAVGLFISLSTAVGVTWFLTQRVRRPLDGLTAAARELSRGHYATRVTLSGAGSELETLAAAFNSMAARLQGVEDTRRRMLSDLAHELRTPIATLSAYHEGLHDGVATLDDQSRAILTEQTARLTRLAEDITEVSTAQEGRLALDLHPHAVSTVLRSAQHGMRDRYAAKGVELVLDGSSMTGLWFLGDQSRIGQVLTNLLTNALRHTPPGGTVMLAACGAHDQVILTVTDDGEGMTAEQVDHAFERFYRGDSARTRDRSGTGIGLTIARAIVDAHGGYIEASSPGPGRGTQIRMGLPRAG